MATARCSTTRCCSTARAFAMAIRTTTSTCRWLWSAASRAGVKGGRHVRSKAETPMTNLLVTMLDRAGVPVERLGDSTGKIGATCRGVTCELLFQHCSSWSRRFAAPATPVLPMRFADGNLELLKSLDCREGGRQCAAARRLDAAGVGSL